MLKLSPHYKNVFVALPRVNLPLSETKTPCALGLPIHVNMCKLAIPPVARRASLAFSQTLAATRTLTLHTTQPP